MRKISIEPGRAYRLNLGEDNPNNCKFHVRAIVDGKFAVVREWQRRGRGWRYRLEFLPTLEVWIDHGFVRRA